MIKVTELAELKEHFDRSLCSRLLFPSLGKTLKKLHNAHNKQEKLELEFLAFKQANTSSFRNFARFRNYFSKNKQPMVPFFTRPRILRWQDLETAGLFTGDEALNNFSSIKKHLSPNLIESLLIAFHNNGLLKGSDGHKNREILTSEEMPRTIFAALNSIYKENLLQEEFIQKYLNHIYTHENPSGLALALVKLKENKLLSHFDIIVGHSMPHSLASALVILNQHQLLNDRNISILSKDNRSVSLLSPLEILNAGGVLKEANAQKYFDAISQHAKPSIATSALLKLHETGLLTHNDFRVLNHSHPEQLSSSLIRLSKKGVLDDERGEQIRQLVSTIQDVPEFNYEIYIKDITSALITLQEAGLLANNEEGNKNYNFLIDSTYRYSYALLAKNLVILHSVGLLNGEDTNKNRAALKEQQLFLLKALKISNLLSSDKAQQNFEALVKYDSLFIDSNLIAKLGDVLRSPNANQQLWEKIVQICERNKDSTKQAISALLHYLDNLSF